MTVKALLDRLQNVVRRPDDYLARLREKNPDLKAIGCVHCLPNFVPEEILDAAGLLPMGIWGSDRPVARAEALMQPFACSMARTTLEIGLEGRLEVLDGIAFSTCCDTLKNLAEIWKSQFPGHFHHSIIFPLAQTSQAARAYLIDELTRFYQAAAGFAGSSMDDKALLASLEKYDAGHQTLKNLAGLRANNPEKLTAGEMTDIVQAASIMERSEFTEIAEQLIQAFPGREPVLDGKRKILLAGTLPMPRGFLENIQKSGGLVVGDDLGLGGKYYERTLGTEGSPLARLADSLLSHSPVSTIHKGTGTRAAHLLELAQATGAEAIIINGTKFCEPEYFDYPDLKKDLDLAGLPCLILETELGAGSSGALSTRIGAFIESLD